MSPADVARLRAALTRPTRREQVTTLAVWAAVTVGSLAIWALVAYLVWRAGS